MKLIYHTTLTPERWMRFSFAEQMANVGSEIFRAMRWRGEDEKLFRTSVDRTVELLDLTIEVSSGAGGARIRELTRLREGLVDYLLYDNVFASSDRSWESYFGAFDLAASKVRASRHS
jgi:hypothetical protein